MKQNNLIRSHAFVGGKWITATSEKVFDVINPATGEVIAVVPDMDRHDVRKAIDAADAAWPAYRDLPAKERSALLRNWFNLMMEHKEELAHLMTIESGKVITESLGEVN